MAEIIQNRKLSPQDILRSSQQQQADKKRELVAQQKEDLKSMKQYYAGKTKELETESAAAVNHISGKVAEENDEVSKKVNTLAPPTYTRHAQKKNAAPTSENTEQPVAKENDTFYKVQDRGSKLSNESDKYVIEAYAPPGEQDNLRVSVQANKAVISGQRKHSGELEQGSKKITTHNYQTFREEFKFDRPVSNDGMTRERIGDFIRFSIPKLEAVPENKEDT